jgi:hypothetical protein
MHADDITESVKLKTQSDLEENLRTARNSYWLDSQAPTKDGHIPLRND